MIQKGALTSFVLYDPCGKNAAHEQYLTSEIRSRIDYLISSDSIKVLV